MLNTLRLEINMKFLKVVVLFSFVLVVNSCTVIGIFADTAIQIASDDYIERRTGLRSRTEIEPFFTKKGLEQDVKLVKILMAKLPEKKERPDPQEVNKKPVLVCKNMLNGQQQCYSSEYYEDMYIADNIIEEDEAKLREE
jgi:hypothetical protein